MTKRMIIRGASEALLGRVDRDPELPPRPELPPPDGHISTRFVGKRVPVAAWSGETVNALLDRYGREVLDVERARVAAREGKL